MYLRLCIYYAHSGWKPVVSSALALDCLLNSFLRKPSARMGGGRGKKIHRAVSTVRCVFLINHPVNAVIFSVNPRGCASTLDAYCIPPTIPPSTPESATAPTLRDTTILPLVNHITRVHKLQSNKKELAFEKIKNNKKKKKK